MTSTRSSPASLARRSATSVLSTSCVLRDAVDEDALESESESVALGGSAFEASFAAARASRSSRSTTNRICLAVIWSFTLCAGASREGSSEPFRPRPDIRRANERAEPLSENGTAGSGSTLVSRSVLWTSAEVQPDDAERTPRRAPRLLVRHSGLPHAPAGHEPSPHRGDSEETCRKHRSSARTVAEASRPIASCLAL